ncbi:hypothetical protein KAJ27_24085 [bacterium]|nr:hypothetical protein [bacterium]
MNKIKTGYYLLASTVDRQKQSIVEDIFCSVFLDVPCINNLTDDYDIVYFLLTSGGCESKFQKIAEKGLPYNYFIIGDSFNNSLPAGLEILSFIKSNFDYSRSLIYVETAADLLFLRKYHDIRSELFNSKIGLIGGSSSWLIGSHYDTSILKKKIGIEIVTFDLDDIICDELRTGEITGEFEKSFKLYKNIKSFCLEKGCDFLSIKCFDLIPEISTTGCIAVSKLNDEGIITSCEGDIPSLLTMILASTYFNTPVFMSNPSKISVKDNSVVFAHCTIPETISDNIEYPTHYESGIGVGIKADIKDEEFIIFKINGELSEFKLFSAVKTEFEYSDKRCRTQVNLKFNENVEELLESPIGNHMIIVPANNNRIDEFNKFLKLFL